MMACVCQVVGSGWTILLVVQEAFDGDQNQMQLGFVCAQEAFVEGSSCVQNRVLGHPYSSMDLEEVMKDTSQ